MTRKMTSESAVCAEDIEQMVKILRLKYGEKAVEVADVLMRDHAVARDSRRAGAWAAVSRKLAAEAGFSTRLH